MQVRKIYNIMNISPDDYSILRGCVAHYIHTCRVLGNGRKTTEESEVLRKLKEAE